MTDRLHNKARPPEQLCRVPAHPEPSSAAADDGLRTLTSSVAVRREGPRAWVRVTGQLTALTRRHLDDWLDYLITTGAGQVTVSLTTADQIDEACLLVLRVAQARLQSRGGELLATAGRAQVRAALTWPPARTTSSVTARTRPHETASRASR